jgi:uncharacterized membrane protein YfcA
MSSICWLCLIAVFFGTAVISVVTGGTSLITVPVMMQFGVEPHVAVATNMFALIFLSAGGTVPFLNAQIIPRKRLPALVGLTLVGSVLGALLLLVVPPKAMPLIIAVAMIFVVVFSLLNRNAGLTSSAGKPSPWLRMAGYAATFVLGIYGGFFSGGYVTLLTAAYVAFLCMTFMEAVAVTKVLNIFSSLVATAIFAWQGVIDWKMGLILGAVSFAGAILGGVTARRMSNLWLRRVFLAAVIVMAVKTIFVDLTSPDTLPRSQQQNLRTAPKNDGGLLFARAKPEIL